MNLYKKIDLITGNFIEDCLFESHPILTTTVTEEITLDDGTTQLIESAVPLLDAEGNTQLDQSYIAEPIPSDMYAVPNVCPMWEGAQWVANVSAPVVELVHEPSETERIEVIEQALLEIILGGAI